MKALKDRGLETLLKAIDGCSRQTFYLSAGPKVWLSNDGILAGLGQASRPQAAPIPTRHQAPKPEDLAYPAEGVIEWPTTG